MSKGKNKKVREKRAPSKFEAFSCLIVLIAGVLFSIVNGLSIAPFLAIAIAYGCIIGLRCGMTWKEVEEALEVRVRSVVGLNLVLILIGFLIGTWMFSGTMPVAIYYLLYAIKPQILILLSFVLCAAVAMAIGTSFGTAGTIGVVMASLGQAVGVPMPMVAGAVISGAHFGQLLSPMSDMSNLSTTLGDTDIYTYMKRQFYISIPTVVICLVAYTIMGFVTDIQITSDKEISALQGNLSQLFNTNPLVLLPLLLLLILCIKKVPVLAAMFLAGVLAIITGCIFNGFSIASGFTTAFSGFDLATVYPDLDISGLPEIVITLVNRGGFIMMAETIVILTVAVTFAGIMTGTGCLNVIVETLFGRVKSTFGLALSTVLIGIITTVSTSSPYMTDILSVDMMKQKYIEQKWLAVNNAAIANSVGSIFEAVVPWCVTGIYMSGITGVPVLSYAPYAILCWGTCVVAVVTSIFKFGWVKIPEDELQDYSIEK